MEYIKLKGSWGSRVLFPHYQTLLTTPSFTILLAFFTLSQDTIVMILQTKFKSSFAILTLLVLYSTTVPLHAHAQFVPRTVFDASSMFIENKAMYITGGRTPVGNQNSTFSIDFTQYWNTSAPVYRLLSTGPSVTWPVPSALIFNSTTWLVLSDTEAYRYDMQLDYWSYVNTPVSYSDVLFTSGAVDPSTDIFYIPNGLRVPGSTLEYTFMQFDIGLNQISNITALGAPDDQLLDFSTTWSPYLRKLVVFGGKGFTSTCLFHW